MPIKHAALRQIRKDRTRHARNQAVRSLLKTLTKQLATLIREKKVEEARQVLNTLCRQYDRAASKKIVHRNTASRHKSRLTQRVNHLH